MKIRPANPKNAPKKSVFGVASTRLQANRIVDHLANAGFDREDISVLLPNGKDEGSSPSEPSTPVSNHEGATVGIGLAVGGALGWLAGMDAFSVPGFGHFVAGGPIGAALMGATAGPAAAHGIKKALVGLGIRHREASLYQIRVKERQILICVQTNEWQEADAARKIFQAVGATNITITGAKASGMLTRAFSGVMSRGQNQGLAPELSPCS